MFRTLIRKAGALGLPVLAALTLTGAASARTSPLNNEVTRNTIIARSRPAAAVITPNRYCYNWDFVNNTGEDANDLHIQLKGVVTVTNLYTGPSNPFGAPDPSSGYNAQAGAYDLNFSNGLVGPGEIAHIGVCSDNPVLVLNDGSGAPPFRWTQDGRTLTPYPLFVGVSWDWLNRRQLHIQLTHDQNVTLTLLSLNLLDATDMLELDDLNESVATQLPLAGVLAEDPVQLAPGGSSFFDVFFGDLGDLAGLEDPRGLAAAPLMEPNHPYVLEAVLEAEDDPGNVVRMYSQALAPLASVYVPITLRQ